MARILNFTVEVSDTEFAAFLERMSSRGVPIGDVAAAIPGAGVPAGDGDEGPVNPNAPQYDSRGIAWLEGVHAGTKGVTAEGHWRRKKGVTNDQMAAAEAAWKAANPGAGPAFVVPGSIAGGAPVTIPAGTVGLPGAPVATGLPGAGLPVAGLPGMTTPPKPVTYEDIGAKYQALAAVGKITPELMAQYYAKHGVTDVNVLMSNEGVRVALMNDLNLLG